MTYPKSVTFEFEFKTPISLNKELAAPLAAIWEEIAKETQQKT